MSVKLLGLITRRAAGCGVTGNRLLVMVMIADCATDDGTGAFPSTASLVKWTGLNTTTVERHLRALEAEGHLSVERHGRRGSRRYMRLTLRGLA